MNPSSFPAIDLCSDVDRFFRDVVEEVRTSRGLPTTDAATSYVVGVLADFADPNRYEESNLERPLTLLLHEASTHRGPDSFQRLRQLGDVVLYLSGFFGEFFERRGVATAYVRSLGAQAYWGARRALSGFRTYPEGPSENTDIFSELSRNFEIFVVLVEGVACDLTGSKRAGNSDLLELYERWLKTRSPVLGAELAHAGLVAQPGDTTVH